MLDVVVQFIDTSNGKVSIQYAVPTGGPVRLALHNAAGQLVREAATSHLSAGQHSVVFDAAALPAGVYFCTLHTAAGIQTARLVVAVR